MWGNPDRGAERPWASFQMPGPLVRAFFARCEDGSGSVGGKNWPGDEKNLESRGKAGKSGTEILYQSVPGRCSWQH